MDGHWVPSFLGCILETIRYRKLILGRNIGRVVDVQPHGVTLIFTFNLIVLTLTFILILNALI